MPVQTAGNLSPDAYAQWFLRPGILKQKTHFLCDCVRGLTCFNRVGDFIVVVSLKRFVHFDISSSSFSEVALFCLKVSDFISCVRSVYFLYERFLIVI